MPVDRSDAVRNVPMTALERQEVFRLQQQGQGVRQIARRFNRAPSTISRILRGRARSLSRDRLPDHAGPPSMRDLRSIEQRVGWVEATLNRVARILAGRP